MSIDAHGCRDFGEAYAELRMAVFRGYGHSHIGRIGSSGLAWWRPVVRDWPRFARWRRVLERGGHIRPHKLGELRRQTDGLHRGITLMLAEIESPGLA